MGTTNSRLKICQVAPSQSQLGEEHSSCQPASPWIITTIQGSAECQQGILGHGQTSQLPPLKKHIPHIVHSLPGQRLERWACPPIFHPQPERALLRRQQPTGRSGIYSIWLSQRNTEGFLPAQTVLNYNTTKKHRAQQRHFREKRREQQRVYTSSIRGTNDEEIQSFRLVSRPTQRDIFWDETKGQCLDLRELLQPTPPPTDPHLTDEMKRPLHPDNESKFGAKGRTDNGLAQGTQGGFSWDMNVRTTNPVRGQINPLPGSDYTTWQENLPWLQDFRTQEKKHVNSHNVLEEGWGRKQWLVTSSRGLRWGEGEMGVDTDGYVNPAQKRNS